MLYLINSETRKKTLEKAMAEKYVDYTPTLVGELSFKDTERFLNDESFRNEKKNYFGNELPFSDKFTYFFIEEFVPHKESLQLPLIPKLNDPVKLIRIYRYSNTALKYRNMNLDTLL